MPKSKISIVKEILGEPQRSGNEYLFYCVFCKHHKKKLSLNLDKNKYKCWICDAAGYLMYENDRDPQPLYYTEHGEELDIAHTSFDEFVSGNLGGEEYAYLYNLDDNWKCYKINYKGPVDLVEIPNYVTA